MSETKTCRTCDNQAWVCENHPDMPWGGLSDSDIACDCGAGSPCGSCNLQMASAGYVDEAMKKIGYGWTGGEQAYRKVGA